jgi:hypothetical protein
VKSILASALVLGSLALLGCESSPEAPTAGPSVAPPAPSVTSGTAMQDLDRMDQRRPVPLLPMMANHQKQNMRDHLLAVQEIVTALATDDFSGVEKAASRIGYSEQMAMMCNHMGAGAPGFTDQALTFHHTADRITTAAKSQDRAGVLKELSETLKTCTGCHAAFKQDVVDDATWRSRTSSTPPSPGMHH